MEGPDLFFCLENIYHVTGLKRNNNTAKHCKELRLVYLFRDVLVYQEYDGPYRFTCDNRDKFLKYLEKNLGHFLLIYWQHDFHLSFFNIRPIF